MLVWGSLRSNQRDSLYQVRKLSALREASQVTWLILSHVTSRFYLNGYYGGASCCTDSTCGETSSLFAGIPAPRHTPCILKCTSLLLQRRYRRKTSEISKACYKNYAWRGLFYVKNTETQPCWIKLCLDLSGCLSKSPASGSRSHSSKGTSVSVNSSIKVSELCNL